VKEGGKGNKSLEKISRNVRAKVFETGEPGGIEMGGREVIKVV
jgi:hypothetical protein